MGGARCTGLREGDGPGEGAVTLELLVGLRDAGVVALDLDHHGVERGAGEIDAVGALAFHHALVGLGDRAAAAAEDRDVTVAALLQLVGDLLEEDDVPAVVGGEADDVDVLLDGGADDGGGRLVVAEVDDLEAVAGQLDVDGRNRAVVSVTHRHRGEDAERRGWAWGRGSGHGGNTRKGGMPPGAMTERRRQRARRRFQPFGVANDTCATGSRD